ncbi:IS66 family element, transposase domain protein [Leptospira inadai serovar Lyme str. 10]|uniref:IS66 family element, transposase domain protein n=2 Tax=Leptospira inadai TaxID=29506 RepID=V6HC73_9LEPT|nr:IS66 family element, transposase domain protein [Leptospira inadai serovar Lyme str. 10]
MCNWTKQVYEKCKPFVSILKQQLLEGSLIGIDETTLQVMKEPNRSNTTKSYMWLFRGGHPDKPVLLYLYRETRSAEFIPKFLNRYQGCIQTDAFSSYDSNFRNWKGVLHGGCFAHARRKFYSVWQSEEDRIAICHNKCMRGLRGRKRNSKTKTSLSVFIFKDSKNQGRKIKTYFG